MKIPNMDISRPVLTGIHCESSFPTTKMIEHDQLTSFKFITWECNGIAHFPFMVTHSALRRNG
jgi:hypothetical protein